MYKIVVLHEDKRFELEAQKGDNLHKLIANANIPIDSSCGGHGTCGKCKIQLIEGTLKPPVKHEVELLGDDIKEGIRLACLQKIRGDLAVRTLTAKGAAKILSGGTDEKEVDGESGYGLAVDIGTTTVAAFMMDLKTGKLIATRAALNAQRPYGGDVVARCGYTMDNPDGLDLLGDLIREQIAQMTYSICDATGINRDAILRAALVGNPTMMHLVAKLPVRSIAIAPYHPQYTDGFSRLGSEVGIGIAPDGIVSFMPVVSGYVGADTIAAVMAAHMDESEELSLLIDIGTNGEIVLGNKYRLITCAAAAGPAFEGGKITCGIGGIAGAIDNVKDDGGPTITTIADEPAKGICGSGLIDAIALLRNKGCIDETGVLSEDECDNARYCERFDDNGNFMLAYEKNDAETDVYLTQKDVREVQLAKSAIAAGINILIQRIGAQTDDIKKVYLAGGFGNYIDYDSACTIGLLPPSLRSKIKGIGNAAGTGARMSVCSHKQRERANILCHKLEYIELAEAKEFSDEFMENMMFPEI